MEERARLKALEALFEPTTTARIVALPAAGEVVIAVEASPVSQYDLMIPGNYMATATTCPPIWAQKESAARSQWATLRTTPSSRLSAKRVSRSCYAASAKFPQNVTDTYMCDLQE